MLSTLYSVSKHISRLYSTFSFVTQRYFLFIIPGLIHNLPVQALLSSFWLPSINHLPTLMIDSCLSFNVPVQIGHSTLLGFKLFESCVPISGSEFYIRSTTSRFTVRLFQPGLYFRHLESDSIGEGQQIRGASERNLFSSLP
jgi:hypothetical protein